MLPMEKPRINDFINRNGIIRTIPIIDMPNIHISKVKPDVNISVSINDALFMVSLSNSFIKSFRYCETSALSEVFKIDEKTAPAAIPTKTSTAKNTNSVLFILICFFSLSKYFFIMHLPNKLYYFCLKLFQKVKKYIIMNVRGDMVNPKVQKIAVWIMLIGIIAFFIAGLFVYV